MIVVTGGAGFIGSNLVAALEERGGEEIVVCDALGSEDKWRNIAKREITELITPDELLSWLVSNIASVHERERRTRDGEWSIASNRATTRGHSEKLLH